jgi:TPR repeat protein
MMRNTWLVLLVFLAKTGVCELEIERTAFRKDTLAVVSQAAKQGDSEAQLELALRYYAGYQVSKNESTAYELMQKSAEQKNPAAMQLLSQMYAEGIGVPVDLQKAESWFIAALVQSPEDRWLRSKFDQLVNKKKESGGNADGFLEKCADAGYPPACLLVYSPRATRLYLSGQYQKALPLLRKLSNAGDDASTLRLAHLYTKGLGGLQRDEARARVLYQQIAERENAEAQYALAGMYEKGEGGNADPVQAELWYKRAADQGHEDAQQRLDQIQEARFPYLLRPLEEVYPKSRMRGKIARVDKNKGKYLSVSGEDVLGVTIRYERPSTSEAAGLSGIILVGMKLQNRKTGDLYQVFNAYLDNEPTYDLYTKSELDVFVAQDIDPRVEITGWAVVYGHLLPDNKTVAVLDAVEDETASLPELLDRNRDAEVLASRTVSKTVPQSAMGGDLVDSEDTEGDTGIIRDSLNTVIDIINPFD